MSLSYEPNNVSAVSVVFGKFTAYEMRQYIKPRRRIV